MSSPRIVSLIASSTEIVCALGFEGSLVGRSHECDYPERVLSLPACTAPRIDISAPSGKIDADVKALVRRALSVYDVDSAKLRELRPDVIITQTQCEVCAVSLKDVEAALSEGLGFKPEIVSLQPNAIEDVWSDIRRVAQALGSGEEGEKLVRLLRDRMSAIEYRTAALSPRPKVACVEWIDPLMAAGNWVPQLVEMAGGQNLFGEVGKHSPWMTYEELRAKDPDTIVVLPCGFDIPRSRREMAALAGREGWGELLAVREGSVFLADGNQYFNRPGPRLAESLEILAEILQPETFPFGWEGKGWERYYR